MINLSLRKLPKVNAQALPGQFYNACEFTIVMEAPKKYCRLLTYQKGLSEKGYFVVWRLYLRMNKSDSGCEFSVVPR